MLIDNTTAHGSRLAHTVGAYVQQKWNDLSPRLKRVFTGKRHATPCSYNGDITVSELNVLSKIVTVSSEAATDEVPLFGRPGILAVQTFRVVYGITHADEAIRCGVERPIEVTSCEPIGAPVIEEKDTICRMADSTATLTGLLQNLRTRAYAMAEADELTKMRARQRLHHLLKQAW